MRNSDWSSDVCSSDLSTAEFLCELHALGFAAGEGRCLLPDLDIAKADLRQHRHFVADGGNGLEEFHRVFHRHVQHVGDGHALELYFEGFAIVARAVANVAGDVDVRQEEHFDLQHAVALTGFASAAIHFSAEAAGLVSAGQIGRAHV